MGSIGESVNMHEEGAASPALSVGAGKGGYGRFLWGDFPLVPAVVVEVIVWEPKLHPVGQDRDSLIVEEVCDEVMIGFAEWILSSFPPVGSKRDKLFAKPVRTLLPTALSRCGSRAYDPKTT